MLHSTIYEILIIFCFVELSINIVYRREKEIYKENDRKTKNTPQKCQYCIADFRILHVQNPVETDNFKLYLVLKPN